MKQTFFKTQSTRPSKFFYKVHDVNHKHPYLRKTCLTCGVSKMMQKRATAQFCSIACGKIGRLNPNFNADPNSPYKTKSRSEMVRYHELVYLHRGAPEHCVHCGTTENRMYHWANVSGNYANVNDFIRLCVPCHSAFDRTKRPTSVELSSIR